jgi:hypothetical protein
MSNVSMNWDRLGISHLQSCGVVEVRGCGPLIVRGTLSSHIETDFPR